MKRRNSSHHGLWRRVTVTGLAVMTFAGFSLSSATFASAKPATDPPAITSPERVYPTENSTMDFTGNDPVSGESRAISVDGWTEGANCDDSSGNDYSPDDCPRLQLTLSSGDPGLLLIPGVEHKEDSQNVDHLVAPSGAVITNSTDPDGKASEIYDINGTADQLNDTLSKMQFVTSQDYREKDLDPSSLPDLDIVAVDGDGALQDETDVQIKVEGPNQGPTISVPTNPLKNTVGTTADYDGDATITDPEICNLSLCGQPFPNQGIADPDSSVLLVAWLDPDCGTFNFGGADFSENGSASNNNVDSLLLNSVLDENQDNGYNSDQRAAIEASINPEALGLDLTKETGDASEDTTVFAGIGTIDNADYALSNIEYTAPSTAGNCNLNVTASDLGNLGTPASYDDSANPTYEVPDAKGANGIITFDNQDTHPHVTVEQSLPGAPGVDPTHTDANFTVTFDQAIDSFDQTDIDTSDSTADGTTCTVVPVTPGTVYSVGCIATQDGKISVKVDAGVVYAQGQTGNAAYSNAASTSSDNEITWDHTDPSETIDPASATADPPNGQTSPTSTSPILYTVKFSEKTTAAASFDGGDIDLSQSTAGGPLVATVTQPDITDLNTFQVAVTGMSSSGDVIATVKPNVVSDQALNLNDASTSTNNDNKVKWTQPAQSGPPTVEIDQASGQSDPATTSPINFTATFSEAVTDFADGDVVLTGSAGATTAHVTGGPTVFNVAVSGMTGAGTVIASIPAGAAQDASLNGNTASTSTDHTVAWAPVVDTTPPSVTINKATGQSDPTSTTPVEFTATFSEPVQPLDNNDIDFTGSTAGGLTANVTGGPTTYTVDVTGMSMDGNVVVSIPAGATEDLSSNLSLASTSTDHQVAWQQPTATSTPDVALTADPATGTTTVGSEVMLTAVVSGSSGDPTGTVDFTDGGASISNVCDSVGLVTAANVTSAVCTTTALPAGSSTIKAAYSGDSTYASASDSHPYLLNQAPTTVVVAGSPASGDVFGRLVTITATVSGAAGNPTGTVAIADGGPSLGASCDSAALSTSGGKTTASCTTRKLPAGMDTLGATYGGDTSYLGNSGTASYVVAKAKTHTTVTVSGSTLKATVTAVAPGAGTPSGKVTFSVGGTKVGTAPLNGSGVATLNHAAGATVAGVYSGDTDFAPSSGTKSTSPNTKNPKITAKVTSAHAKSPAGWYRSAVTVRFTCTKGSAPLTAPCPKSVTFTHNVANGSVTKTIHATDGGVAMVTVSPINVDETKPTVKVGGVKSGHSYIAPGPSLKCLGSDSLSGIARCKLNTSTHGDTVSYTATATDEAGNSATVHGRYTLSTTALVGVSFSNGRFNTKLGHNYTVDVFVHAKHAPRYVNAAPQGTKPTGGRYPMHGGPNKWTIEITITHQMAVAHTWDLGVYYHGHLHRIPIRITS